MIELSEDRLVFWFPEVHDDAFLSVEFQRTLRIPDDGATYPLPPARGNFPLRHVDDFGREVPADWVKHGGTMLPMYQAEAMWLKFHSPTGYPFAIKVAAGKINAVSGKPWDDGLDADPQNYVVYPGQAWLDGYVVAEGTVRQFVAMPLGAGYSAEEQITGRAEFGGLQIQAFPLRAERWIPPLREIHREALEMCREEEIPEGISCMVEHASGHSAKPDMALGMGGSMEERIYQAHRPLDHWDTANGKRCFVHLANAMVWRQITGQAPPTVPPTAKEYTRAGLPWYGCYAQDLQAIDGSPALANLDTIDELAKMTGQVGLPENASVTPGNVVPLSPGEMR